MKRVIITGADGFVGSYTVNYFLEMGLEVLALDLCDKPRRLEKHEKLLYRQCNISDLKSLFELINPGKYDTFIHFAWAGSAGAERTNYNLQIENALNAVNCMNVAKKVGCKRFVGAGSIMEYEVEAAIHKQKSEPGMGYIYGIGKHLAHCLCKTVASEIGIEMVWPMITNAYGVGEMSPRFINSTLRKIINSEPLQFTAATQNYDFVYVSDVAKAFYYIAKNGKNFSEYMIGSSQAKPLREFIEEIQQTLAPDRKLQFGDVPFTGVNMPVEVFDSKQTEEECGFETEVSFSEGISRTMEWLKTVN